MQIWTWISFIFLLMGFLVLRALLSRCVIWTNTCTFISDLWGRNTGFINHWKYFGSTGNMLCTHLINQKTRWSQKSMRMSLICVYTWTCNNSDEFLKMTTIVVVSLLRSMTKIWVYTLTKTSLKFLEWKKTTFKKKDWLNGKGWLNMTKTNGNTYSLLTTT